MSLAQRLCCPQLRDLTPYASARRSASGGNVWLNANESPWRNANVAGINRYPDCQPPQLRQAYADYASVAPSQVLISRGADEGIELLIRAFCVPGQDKVVSLTPSYGMYRISAETCGIDYQAIPWQQGYTLPPSLVDAGRDAKLLFICNPNNPTGTLVPTDDLLQLARALPETLVVIDEAYIEFCPQQSLAASIAATPNLVVLRTLSKAFALAGARCGFVLANDDVIAMLEKVIAPYPVPVPVSDLALETLSNFGIRRMQSQVSQLNARRQALITALDALPGVGTILDSASNFVLFEADNADVLLADLAANGILIRAYSALPGWLRVSIGSDSEMSALMAALEPALQQPRQDAQQ